MLEEDPQLQSVFDSLVGHKERLKVLEVGCGSCSYVDLGKDAYIVGIDISQKQLDRNEVLNEKILADVETYQLPENEFDVVICWWILEHLSQPEKALINCQKALKKEGIMILAIPNVKSIKGLITKYTPHSFHVLVYRYVFGEKLAGVGDRVPFKTFLRYSLAPNSIKKFARECGLSIERFHLYENPRQKRLRERNFAIDMAWKVLGGLTKVVTFGNVEPYLTDFIVVMKKTETSAVPA